MHPGGAEIPDGELRAGPIEGDHPAVGFWGSGRSTHLSIGGTAADRHIASRYTFCFCAEVSDVIRKQKFPHATTILSDFFEAQKVSRKSTEI